MRVYGYVRISRDEDKESYSSIIQQKNLIYEAAEELGYTIAVIYEDDNASGYTFDRAGFSQLIDEIKEGKVDILLVKDSSRIGRHNAKTLLFFELLEENNTRLILINENYDSNKDSDDILGLRTWYNEMYVKDISRKITGSIRNKQKNGGLIIRNTYGYLKDKLDKHRLVIDYEAAEVVRYIFRLYINGLGYRKIAEILNSEKIPTPSQYIRNNFGGNQQVADSWNPVHVQRIITNDLYTGTLRCGKTKKKRIKGESEKIALEDQITYKDHHNPIISVEDFEMAREISLKRSERKIRGGEGGINLFSGFLFCSCCGSYMIAKRRNKRVKYYCGRYHQMGKGYCNGHNIDEDVLIMIILENIKKIAIYNSIDDKGIKRSMASLNKAYDLTKVIRSLEASIGNKRNQMKNYARLYGRGRLEYSLYNELMEEEKLGLEGLEGQLESYRKRVNNSNNIQQINIYGIIDDIIKTDSLLRSDVEILIDKIYIGIQEEANLDAIVYWNISNVTMGTHNQGDVKLDQGPLTYTLDP